MVVLNNGDILCLFETGKLLPYAGISTTIIKQILLIGCDIGNINGKQQNYLSIFSK